MWFEFFTVLCGPMFRSALVSFFKGNYKYMKQRLNTGLVSDGVSSN